MKYRPEIDGLRTLAVIPVVIFHAGEKYFPKGYLGVDIFFVISGFLITAILMAELESKTFSFVNFYRRRARRILPALFFIIFCCVPIASFSIYSTQELVIFASSVVAGLLFLANFFYWFLLGDYFAPAAEYQPLLHLWSLAVEEQFYLFFPFLLILLAKISQGMKLLWLGILSLLSFAFNMVLVNFDPLLAFYMFPTRFWELAASGLIAIAALDRSPLQRMLLEFLSCLGAGLIVLSYGWAAFSTTYIGILPLVLGVCLVLAFARQGTFIARCLSLKGMVAIGLVSYSFYLWHQPVFVFARYYWPDSLASRHYFILAALTLLLAVVTYYYVEQPWRRKVTLPPPPQLAVGIKCDFGWVRVQPCQLPFFW